MSQVVARTLYDSGYVAPFEGAPGAGIDCSKDVVLTKQSDMKDADINNIMKRFEKTGILPDLIAKDPTYGDFFDVPDFQAALNIVRHAEQQFAALDAPLRNRFDNDPAKFLAFVNDEGNIEEMDKLGLLNDSGKAKLKAKRDAAFAAAEVKRAAEQKAMDEAAKNKPA